MEGSNLCKIITYFLIRIITKLIKFLFHFWYFIETLKGHSLERIIKIIYYFKYLKKRVFCLDAKD